MPTTPRFRSARAAEHYLLGFINYEIRAGYRPTTRTHDLHRFSRLLESAGWIPGAVPTVHVGGTNAKGTVATLLARILRAGGVRTGLYTSPHLHSMRERIRIDGRSLEAEAFRAGVEAIAARFGGEPGAGFRTTFEHLTALALLAFQEAGVECAVVEVGLGGRLDATNVLPAGPAVLTPVSLDHRQVLGNTVGEIAADKAHILKRGGLALLMPQTRAAAAPILGRARRLHVPVIRTRDAVSVRATEAAPGGMVLRVRGREDYGGIGTGLLGAHQADNVGAAVAAAETVLPAPALVGAVRWGLRRARVPGRLETLERDARLYVLDGGHNPAAGRAVAAALALHFPGRRWTAVVGMAEDKDHRAYLRALAPVVERWVFTRARSPRAAPPDRLAERVPGPSQVSEGVAEALGLAAGCGGNPVLVAGSFLVVGEARALLGRRRA